MLPTNFYRNRLFRKLSISKDSVRKDNVGRSVIEFDVLVQDLAGRGIDLIFILVAFRIAELHIVHFDAVVEVAL